MFDVIEFGWFTRCADWLALTILASHSFTIHGYITSFLCWNAFVSTFLRWCFDNYFLQGVSIAGMEVDDKKLKLLSLKIDVLVFSGGLDVPDGWVVGWSGKGETGK